MAAGLISLPFALLETDPVLWHTDLIGAMAWSVLGLTLGGSSLLYMLIQRGAAAAVTSVHHCHVYRPRDHAVASVGLARTQSRAR